MNIKLKIKDFYHKYSYYIMPVLILMAIMSPFTFSNTIWGDEGFTILTLKESIWEIIKITAADVHPPLYYLIAKIVTVVFGNTIMVLKWVSIIPILLVVIKILAFYKEYGSKISVKIGIVIAVLLLFVPHMIEIATELRMYSWALLFVTGTGIAVVRIYKNRFTTRLVWEVVLYALAAAYTHYFALVSVGMIILLLCIDTCIRRKKDIKYCFYIMVTCCVGYLPWLFIFAKQLAQVSGNYWIAPIGLKSMVDFIQYPFHTMSRNFYLVFIGIVVIINIQNMLGKDRKQKENSFMALALMSVFVLTVICGSTLSILIRPIFIIRYATPCFVLLWMGVFVGIGNITKDKWVFVMFMGVIFMDGILSYNTELGIARDTGFTYLQQYAEECINEEDLVVTNNSHFDWTILPFYFETDYIKKVNDSTEIIGIIDSENTKDMMIYYVEVGGVMEPESELFPGIEGNYEKVLQTTVPLYGNVKVWRLQIK